MLAVSGDEPEEGCRREATTPHECSCAAYQTHVQSHAATVPVSSDSKPHASQSQKVQTASLVSCHHHLTKQIYIRWCCIDLSNAPRLSGVEVSLTALAPALPETECNPKNHRNHKEYV